MNIEDESMISIGEASEKTGLPESTIRYYDREFPEFLNIPRGNNNERLFTPKNLEDLEYIRFLIKRENLTVEEVKTRLDREEKFRGESAPASDQAGSEVAPSSAIRPQVFNEEIEDKFADLSAAVADLSDRIDNLQQQQNQILELLDMNLQRYNKLVEHLPD